MRKWTRLLSRTYGVRSELPTTGQFCDKHEIIERVHTNCTMEGSYNHQVRLRNASKIWWKATLLPFAECRASQPVRHIRTFPIGERWLLISHTCSKCCGRTIAHSTYGSENSDRQLVTETPRHAETKIHKQFHRSDVVRRRMVANLSFPPTDNTSWVRNEYQILVVWATV